MRTVRVAGLATGVLAAALAAAASRLLAQPSGPSPTQVASEQERERELSELGLKATRPGADNRDPSSPLYPNYDEAKANPVPLPDPLTEPGGKRVTSAAQWRSVRRPQIVKAMEDDLYGHRPAALPKVSWTVTAMRRTDQYGVPAVEKTLDGALDNAADPAIAVHIKAWLVTPDDAVKAHRKTPVVLAADALKADRDVDASRIAIFGHSRYGKAALVAMAYDDRFKAGFISSSGAGGAAPYRRHWGEQVENVAGAAEYHWMGADFLRYAADPMSARDLPIDANAVIALAAPRAVFVGAGRPTSDGDGWVDPPGMFKAEASAGEVWALYGKTPLGKTPPAPLPLSDSGPLAYRQHDQGHTPGPNWPYFLDFADRAFKAGRNRLGEFE